MKPALVLLAAGASRRLGRCKALVELGGQTALARLLAAGTPHCAGTPLVLTGADHRAIAAALEGEAVEVLENPDWAAGRTGGLQLALDARPERDLCLAPVDCPLVPGEVFAALVEHWLAQGRPARGWLAPRAPAPLVPGGPRHGHPVLVGRELAAELAAFAADRPLKDLRARAEPLFDLPLPYPEVLLDLDTPADLERLRRFAQTRFDA